MLTSAVWKWLGRRPDVTLVFATAIAVACGSVISGSTRDAELSSAGNARCVVATTPHPTGETLTGERHETPAVDSSTAAPLPEVVATAIAPEELRFVEECLLRVQKQSVSFAGADEQGGPREIEMLMYNGRLVGPTIRVQRGARIKINVINELPAFDEPEWTAATDQADPPHDLYTTNLHTHGLHVSPAGAGDNVFREIPPGTSYQYEFTIPADHPAGTFWYHPHKHGSVAYQLGNGMAGALIVEGVLDDKICDLDDIPEIAAAKEQVMVLQQLVLQTDASGIGRVDPRDSYNEPGPDVFRVTTVNGQVLPTYTMAPREIQRWRFIGAGREGSAMLCWYDDRDMRVNHMPFHEIAVDGLATGRMTARRSVTLFPGKRSDCLVQAPQRPGTYFLAALQEDESPGANEMLIVNYLARLVVQGIDQPMALPRPDQLAACKPFESIDREECRAQREIVLSFDDKKRMFHVNGLSYNEQSDVDRHLLGSAEEWTLTALDAPEGTPNEPHPFHIHVNPFEVIEIEDVRTKVRTKVSEWRDTFAVEPGKKVTIRMRFRDFAGKTVFHCHTLDHEDQGMMRDFEIVNPARTFAAEDNSRGTLDDCLFAAPSLAALTTEGIVWDVKLTAGRPVILVFFRGMRCGHCVKELRELLQEARSLAGTDVLAVAVSSDPIADSAKALNLLRVPTDVEFHLLVDESWFAFRSFDCFDEHPQHGLFVIDKMGVVRARHVGEAPFDDPREVCARIRQLIESDRQTRP